MKEHRMVSGMLTLLALGASFSPTELAHADSSENVKPETKLVQDLNLYRQSKGLKPLVEDSRISRAAKARSDDMVQNNYIAHESPADKTAVKELADNNVPYAYYGELIAMNNNSVDTAENKAFESLIGQPAHEAVIADQIYTEVGVGLSVTADGREIFDIIVTDSRPSTPLLHGGRHR